MTDHHHLKMTRMEECSHKEGADVKTNGHLRNLEKPAGRFADENLARAKMPHSCDICSSENKILANFRILHAEAFQIRRILIISKESLMKIYMYIHVF